MKILISDYEDVLKRDLEYEIQLLKEHLEDVEIEVYAYRNYEDYLEKMKDVDVLLMAYLPVDKKVFEHAKKLKLISVNATGYGTIDMEQAALHQVQVVTVKDYCTNEVADHTMALILALIRNLKFYEKDIEQRHHWEYMNVKKMRRIASMTLAIFGLGRIGRAVVKRAQAFGMKVIAVDPYVSQEEADGIGVTMVSKEEALNRADVISNHMNQTKENENFFQKQTFAAMKKHPIFINVGRGKCVDETALVQAIEKKQLAGAGLDVLKEENPNLIENPLLNRENVILTPHAAFYSEESMRDLQRISCENIIKELKVAEGRKQLCM
ncbi:D-3-phosphoglycerate dehydrogenase [Lachnospiraceae bacterium KM106-2]|nr:D-3-phosphoglycerate dehydrogenase [Lachnospiraceae bacterium KM106-2]